MEAALRERQRRHAGLLAYLNLLEGTGDLVIEFDERLWNLTADTVTVKPGDAMVFQFKDGREMEWQ